MAIGRLTALKVKSLVLPGRYNDGGGLYLQVRDAEHRSWLYRYKIAGRPRQMGLGPLHDVTLAEAQEKAQRYRKLAREKIDPIEQRHADRAERVAKVAERMAKPAALTFKQVAEQYIARHEASWKNEKHRAQWPATLRDYVYPIFGNRSVSSIGIDDVESVLTPIWISKPETASRVRGRIETVLNYAAAANWRQGDNPARWEGALRHRLPARSRMAKVKHHAALPWAEMGPFMAALAAEPGAPALALQFTILTAARTGESLGARWFEFDLAAKLWTVPAGRMKAGVEHRVPLSDAAIAVLDAMRPLKDAVDGFVFPGRKAGAELSNMSMAMLLRRMERADLTVHGFRSSFRDWAGESTSYPREVAEAALAHTVGSKVEAAYRRGDLFTKRVKLMADWASFCTNAAVPAGKVVAFPAAAHA